MLEDITLDFGAITIDNSILKSEGYKFNEGLLNQMAQFANSPVRIIQSDIIHNEAKRHIAVEIENARSTIKKVLRSASKQLKISKQNIAAASELLSVPGEDLEIAEERLKEYYERIGAEILESDIHIDCKRLMKLYFETKAPFEGAKDKKSEFPDAIALISLENWAEENKLNVIAVSADKGWKAFSDNSTRIKVIENLSAAMEIFQPHNQVRNIIAQIREDALLDAENHVLKQIKKAIIDSLDPEVIVIHATCDCSSYEESSIDVEYINHELEVDDKGLVNINVVRIEENVIVLQVRADIECDVTANFDFYMTNWHDSDEINIGRSTDTIDQVYNSDILISLTGDFSKDLKKLKVTEIEVLDTIKHVHFGEIGLDYDDYFGE